VPWFVATTVLTAFHTSAYSLVPFRRHGSINRHTSFIWPCTFPKIWGVTINWINTQFWSTSRGTFDKNNLAPIAYTFVGVSINWIVTFSMPWGVTINWNMSSNWHQRVLNLLYSGSLKNNCDSIIKYSYFCLLIHIPHKFVELQIFRLFSSGQ